MAITKAGYNIKFGEGLDLKTDPNQVQAGKFLALQNVVFNTGGLMTKRNGFALKTTLPNTSNTNLRTLNDNLVATGKTLSTYSMDTNQWVLQGSTHPVDLSVQPLVRNASSQTVVDSATAANGLVCTAYTDSTGAHYQVQDSETGQAIVHAVAFINSTATACRVFVLGNYFVITYLVTIAGTPHLQYIALPVNNPTMVTAPTDISTLVSGLTAGYDAVVSEGSMYIAWESTAGNLRIQSMSSTLVVTGANIIAGHASDLMSVTSDESGSNPVIWMSFWDNSANNAYTAAFNQILAVVLAPTQFLAGVDIHQLTSKANSQLLTLLYENVNTYSFTPNARTDFVTKNTVTQAGVVGSSSVVLRSVGIQSKMFADSAGTYYALLSYGQAFQPTYFLSDLSGNVIAKLAYSNGAGYTADQVLASVSTSGTVFSIPYLFKDLIVPVNKSQGVANVAGVYAQNGVNLAMFDLGTVHQYDSEIARTLHLTGGLLWMFDSVKPVEHGFNVWPEDIGVTTSGAGGTLAAQQYFYQVTYEWTDAQGNIHRSAPSIPVGQVTTGATSSNTLSIPTLRLTYKTTPNAVRIVIYRWSTGQQNYYQVTSIQNPLLNNPAVDSVTYVDTQADSQILGNALVYTTGGIIENIGAPASNASTLFKSRLFIVDSEDRNLLWYSKQVIEATPVEMSDLFTIFVAPTAGAQGSTGSVTALSALDDKLIVFKRNALYYIVGSGPDNTGGNNDFSEPVYITGTVGCDNQSSIVQTPLGLMFQSDKGIWLLGRDLTTKYIGAAIQSFNDVNVNSALTVPGTNQVRFTLDDGTVLMYDYYYDQWGTFNGIPAISSTLQDGTHTFLNKFGQVLQEKASSYIDNTHPVLISYSTAWIKLTELQGFQRAYYLYLLSNYVTPHKLSVQVAYDYDKAPRQNSLITPTNYSTPYGSDTLYGSTPTYGGASPVEQWRVFFQRQKCQAIQVSVSEIYDPSLGVAAGAGLTMSGFNIVIGGKSTHPRLPSSNSVG